MILAAELPDHGDGQGRELYRGTTLSILDRRCRSGEGEPGSRLRSPGFRVVFVRSGSFVRHRRGGRTFADPTRALFYNPGQIYRISHPVPRGDRRTEFRLAATLVQRLVTGGRPAGPACPRFPADRTAVSARAFLLHHRLVRYLEDARVPEPTAVEETALALLREVLTASRLHGRAERAATRAHRRRAHRESVEMVQGIIRSRYHERLTLDELSAAVSYSSYYLCRLFRRETGLTVHQYLTQTRLRTALERIAGGADDLSQLALEMGFSSHSHMTDTFRRTFGCPPSRIRERATARDMAELREALADGERADR